MSLCQLKRDLYEHCEALKTHKVSADMIRYYHSLARLRKDLGTPQVELSAIYRAVHGIQSGKFGQWIRKELLFDFTGAPNNLLVVHAIDTAKCCRRTFAVLVQRPACFCV